MSLCTLFLLRSGAAIAATVLVATLHQPAAAAGTRVGARAGFGSMLFNGGHDAPESELSRHDSFGNQASAHAVLRTGSLHAYALAHSDQPTSCRWEPHTCLPSAASAQAEFWDIVTFTRSELADPTQVRWRFDIHGIETDGPLNGGGSGARFSYYVGPTGNWSPYSAFTINDGDVIRGSLTMTGATMRVAVYGAISVQAWMGGAADYGNTARFNFELPPGVTFTSESREFLIDRPPLPPVPEPPALALALAGLASLGWLQRRRGKAAANR